PDPAQLFAGTLDRVAEARELRLDLVVGDARLAHRELLALVFQNRPHADPGRGRDSGELHGSPPNFPSTSSCSAVSASRSSGPSARTRIVLPSSAASIITPMMLLPFTSRSSRATRMSDLNLAAVFTNSAQARACSPS